MFTDIGRVADLLADEAFLLGPIQLENDVERRLERSRH